MISPHPDFCCAICQRNISTRWSCVGRDELIPPICTACERGYSEGIGKPTAGSFRDRREAIRIYALAEALYSAAMRIKWSAQYAA